ncbi:secreted protein [gut metagenome]|uniref:Secreted protein n=1 Tax=gut metagenome TaxID=749906 RepID=J9FP65_9ZZZZ
MKDRALPFLLNVFGAVSGFAELLVGCEGKGLFLPLRYKRLDG